MSTSPTGVKPTALTSHCILHKLLHEGIPPSHQCRAPAPASLCASAVPPQIQRAEAGGAKPWVMSYLLFLVPTGDSLGTAAWQLSPAMGQVPADALKTKSLKFGKQAAHALAFRLAYLNNYMSEAIPECLGICRNIFHLCTPQHQSQRAL